jgi:hypothetical protein
MYKNIAAKTCILGKMARLISNIKGKGAPVLN